MGHDESRVRTGLSSQLTHPTKKSKGDLRPGREPNRVEGRARLARAECNATVHRRGRPPTVQTPTTDLNPVTNHGDVTGT